MGYMFGIFYMICGIAAAVGVSLLTPAADQERLDRYYNLIKTPTQPGEVIEEPCRLPEGIEPAYRPMLVSNQHFEIPVPSRTSVMAPLLRHPPTDARSGRQSFSQ
ncbi:MAG: hypothetical protein AAF492_09965 [Verrucomicrobiota bacterium]